MLTLLDSDALQRAPDQAGILTCAMVNWCLCRNEACTGFLVIGRKNSADPFLCDAVPMHEAEQIEQVLRRSLEQHLQHPEKKHAIVDVSVLAHNYSRTQQYVIIRIDVKFFHKFLTYRPFAFKNVHYFSPFIDSMKLDVRIMPADLFTSHSASKLSAAGSLRSADPKAKKG